MFERILSDKDLSWRFGCNGSEDFRVFTMKSFKQRSRYCLGNNASTKPDLKAFLPLRDLPVSIMSKAFGIPMRIGRRWVPPKPGRIPRLTSGSAIFALDESVTTRYVQHNASSAPPPMQAPSITAIVGKGRVVIFVSTSCPRLTLIKASSVVWRFFISDISAPAIKISGFADDIVAIFMALLTQISSRIVLNSVKAAAERIFAFWLGVSNVIAAMPS